MTLHHKNGQSYDALLQIAPIVDERGTVISYLTSHRDISRIETLQRMQTRFISNVSHELRTPIAILKLYADMLPTAPSDRRSNYERALQLTAESLSHLVEDILRVNSLSGDGVRMAVRRGSLSELVEGSIFTIWLPAGSQEPGELKP